MTDQERQRLKNELKHEVMEELLQELTIDSDIDCRAYGPQYLRVMLKFKNRTISSFDVMLKDLSEGSY